MNSKLILKRYHIYLLPKKYFHDTSSVAWRPCVVISIHGVNCIVLPITSQENEHNVKLETHISKKYPISFVKISNIVTLPLNKNFQVKNYNKKLKEIDIRNINEMLIKILIN